MPWRCKPARLNKRPEHHPPPLPGRPPPSAQPSEPGAAPSHGNRVSCFSRNEAEEELFVPVGLQSFGGHGHFGGMPAQQVVGDEFDGDEVCRCMFGAHPAFIVAEGHVHQPMHTFDGPMAPHDTVVFADGCLFETVAFLLAREQRDILVQAAAIAFQGQHIIDLFVENLGRDLTLAPHRVDGE